MADNIHKIVVEGDTSKAIAEMKKLSDAMKEYGLVADKTTNKATMSMTNAFGKLGSKLTSIGTSLSVGITAPLVLLGKTLFDSATNIETIATSFEVFTGSIESAKNLLTQLKDVALKSPLQFQDITKATQTMLGYGLTADQATFAIRMLGDVSGGNADKLQRLALAFGQVNASGRLMAQEARQMINAGFNPLQSIADKTGKSMAQLTKEMKDGKISVQDVADAFEYATQPGGRFFDMMGKQSETLRGQYNKLSESVTFAMSEIGTSVANSLEVQKFFTYLGDVITTLKDKFLSLSDETKGSIAKFATFLVVLGPAALIIGGTVSSIVKLVETFAILRRAILLLEASTGIGVVIAVIGLLGGAAILAADKIMKLGDAIDETAYKSHKAQSTFKVTSIIDDIEKVKGQIRSLQKNKIDPTQGIFTVADGEKKLKGLYNELANLQKIYKQVTDVKFNKTPPGLDKPTKDSKKYETIAFPDFITKDVGTKIKSFIQENKDAATTISNWWSTSETKRLSELKKNYDKDVAFANKYGLDLVDIEKKYESERLLITQKFSEGKVSAREDARKKIIEQSTQDVSDALTKQSATLNGLFSKLKADDAKNSLSQFASSIYSAQRDFAMNISVGFAEIAGAALAGAFNVQDAFKALGSMFVGAIGDLLIKVGTAAIELGLFKEGIETALKSIGGGAGMVALGIAAIAAGSALKSYSGKINDSMSTNKTQSVNASKSSNTTGMTSGSSYQYGGASYSTQSLKLSIDLTGAITATQTGYQINKSLETTLRVTGRQ